MQNGMNKVHEFYKKMKIIVFHLEQKSREYFSAKGADIYTRFVRRMFFMIILACLVAGVVSGAVLMIASIAKPIAKVPSVTGLNVLEAAIQIQQKGLLVEIDSKFDPSTEKYIVIEQYPRKGVTVKKGRIVTLLVSMGKDVYTVPDLVGKNRNDAEKLLSQLNINYEMTVVQNSDYPINTVISQDLPPKVEESRSVKLKVLVNSDVSKGEFRMGDYTHQSIDIVAKTLIANSIQVILDKVTTKNENEDGIVLSQSISTGTIVPKNTDVHLQVGVYGEDDRERDKFKYYVFSYFVGGDSGTTNTSANNGQNSGQSVRITISDEKDSQQEVYNKTITSGEMIVVTFKAYGKAKLNLIINNNFVKEIPYE